MEMCRSGVGASNTLFSLWRALCRPTAPASRTKRRRMAEESRTTISPITFLNRYSQKKIQPHDQTLKK